MRFISAHPVVIVLAGIICLAVGFYWQGRWQADPDHLDYYDPESASYNGLSIVFYGLGGALLLLVLTRYLG